VSDSETFDCPSCEADVPVTIKDGCNIWSLLGEEVTCPQCGATLEIDGDYAGEGWGFWANLVKRKC
jgi:transcription elongation factor Elf1